MENENQYKEFDTYDFGLYKKLSGIQIRSGWVVDAIGFVYNTDKSLMYGGSGGNLDTFSLQDGEFITQVDWTIGKFEYYPKPVVCTIRFTTNLGRVFSAGSAHECENLHNYTLKAADGMCYHSFKGRYDSYLLDINVSRSIPINWYEFDDAFYAHSMRRITEIRINSGWVVDGIQIVYDGDKESDYHGGTGGSRTTLKLQDDEYITTVSGKTGKYAYQNDVTLCKIVFKTNKGRTISGGTTERCSNMMDFSFEALEGDQIFALSGSYSGYMRTIRISWYKPKDKGC